MAKVQLRRAVSFSQLFLYGLGTIIGGGFYALLGKIAGVAGVYTAFSFFLAGFVALFSALSYSELSSRYPYSAGEAHFVENGFKNALLTKIVGWLVVITGITSAATLVVACGGFLEDITGIHMILGAILTIIGLGALAIWGIRQSMFAISVITVIEVGTLLFILWNTSDILVAASAHWWDYIPGFELSSIMGVMGGAFLAFYVFIGFEDMVNIAEEVKNVRQHMPKAILAALIVSTLLYVGISITALELVSVEEFEATQTPLGLVMQKWGGMTVLGVGLVSLLAGLNGALVQILMASRVGYGMAQAHRAPEWMAEVEAWTQTPGKSTLLMTGLVFVLAMFFPLILLAKITSFFILVVFLMANLALIRIKQTDDPSRIPLDARTYPAWVPKVGAFTSGAILFYTAIALFLG